MPVEPPARPDARPEALFGEPVDRCMTAQRLCAVRRGPLAAVEWRDLVDLRPAEIAHELFLSVPWLAASLIAAYCQSYVVALGCSFMFFLTGLRQVHNAYHYALGLPRAATEWVMFVLSVLMLGSMHAVKLNHLRHHRHCMQSDDIEAMSACMPGWRAILVGPLFPFRLHHRALQLASAPQRRWIRAELAANGAWLALVFGFLKVPWLEYHVAAMALGQSLTAFFAVWTVHHDCGGDAQAARTIRHRVKALATYNMFYHLEHHLFPAVPTCKLPLLARRLDAAAPEMSVRQVF
jgi:fatty acid desaturase